MTATQAPPITLRSCADLIASVPYLLGFHPSDSIVVIAIVGVRVRFVARGDLPGGVAPEHIARRLLSLLQRDTVDTVAIVGYGPSRSVTPAAEALCAALKSADIHTLDVLRVDAGRYWSYVCTNPTCCPPEGKTYDPTTTCVGAAAVYAGRVALPDRDAVAASIAPVDGAARMAMTEATTRADARLTALVEGARSAPDNGQPRLRTIALRSAGAAVRANARVAKALRTAGDEAVDAAFDRYRAGRRLTDDEVAWLSVLLVHLPVRDHAWEHSTDDDWQVDLWSDVVRRVDPPLAAAPASLLAYTAWRSGHGALATIAVERALAVDPDYALARMIDEILDQCLPPSIVADAEAQPHRASPRRDRRTTRRRWIGPHTGLDQAS
ncbi:uncharacterized protein DUF4192 [Asanoa ferruginea]|uniref:Uncharacterized protein DUF4192 n=1 Tax=Asanoa ferruginea TaxID=53367 RepID=A0A3D9ZG99_9ACTN|nr:DUF4192 domain-containing protein [Asanoa ferruginea]REF96287.1 uncharacterized protein DUF4192 [Asanoa ferruginea]GIF46937.1 hypothetical protein Afe04nite_14760 [Asanoa ferruginea]